MKIRQLEAFRATVIEGTMSAAAEALRTSQPTISRHLIELERTLQVQLFRREKGRAHLTHEGLQFYRRVEEVFSAFTSLGSVAQDLRDDSAREIRITASFAFSMTIVPDVMARMLQKFPDLRVQVLTVDKNSYFEAHCETEFDVILGNRIGFESTMKQVPLAEVDFICALPSDHRLVGKDEIHVSDLEGETMISLLEEDKRLFLKHERLFEDAKVNVTQNLYCHSSASAYAMVRRGLGIALMEPFSAAIWEQNGVVTRPFRPQLTYEYVAGLKPGVHPSTIVSEVISTARDVLSRFSQG
ncbi:LysR substrate-binding domain-containing protein [uncultured Tateyamaria sp.]|uniref:LysR family transcriptional regulator n=1 Tax=uncultured Tateyamaria sp. TaxID=455651 RepID=UPI002623828F|nr:LysR substrate-binding domain-containing protein [uncultured Tateyamaria sp.]